MSHSTHSCQPVVCHRPVQWEKAFDSKPSLSEYYIKKSHVKFEDAKAMLRLLVKPAQYWMFSFDIKSGYHHIDIHASDQQFLGFAWVFDSKPRYFVFTVLPFGLSTGPYIFTKVIRPLVKHWRSKPSE